VFTIYRIQRSRWTGLRNQAESGRTTTPREDAAWEAILAEAIADAMNAGADGQDIQAATA